jgi:hypothetical protein
MVPDNIVQTDLIYNLVSETYEDKLQPIPQPFTTEIKEELTISRLLSKLEVIGSYNIKKGISGKPFPNHIYTYEIVTWYKPGSFFTNEKEEQNTVLSYLKSISSTSLLIYTIEKILSDEKTGKFLKTATETFDLLSINKETRTT